MSFDLHRLHGTGQSLGLAIGRRFQAPIRAALADNSELRDHFRPYHRSPAGQLRYAELLAVHERRYPAYVAELQGCAEGAEVPFEDLFLINLRGEYRGYAAPGANAQIGECSTCSLLNSGHAVVGHNEDGAVYYHNRSYLIHVEPGGAAAAFLALCYPGFLPSNAFGANRHGLCYAINNVRPTRIQAGLGRHFLARSLLQARSLEDAVARLSVGPRAAGFNFTLASLCEPEILNVEVSPADIHIHTIQGRYFHANHYRHLQLEQQCEPSSLARQRRGDALLSRGLPEDSDGVLGVLRDQADPQLPIWRQGRGSDPGVTLLSAVFDLRAASLTVYPGPLDCESGSSRPLLSVALAGDDFGCQLQTTVSAQ